MKLYLIDGAALFFRSYYAFVNNPLINSKGKNVGAAYGFANSILKILKDCEPDYFAITFDSREKTFRHHKYEAYKANRSSMPEDLVEQLPLIFEFVEKSQLVQYVYPGFEADDIIGSLAKRAFQEEVETYIVSGDKDLLQLLNEKTRIYNIRAISNSKETQIFDEDYVQTKFGVGHLSFKDYLALTGDASDNIPGVKGVGKKTAQKLINTYGSLEEIYENLSKIKPDSLRKKLETDKDNAFLSQDLVTIDQNMDIPFNLDDLTYKEQLPLTLLEWVEHNEFFSLKKYFSATQNIIHNDQKLQKKDLFDDLQKVNIIEAFDTQVFEKFISNKKSNYCISLCEELGKLFIYNNNQILSCKIAGLKEKELKCLVSFFDNSANLFVGFELKKVIKYLLEAEIVLNSNLFCLSLSEFLIDSEQRNPSFYNICRKYLPEFDYAFTEDKNLSKNMLDVAQVFLINKLYPLIKDKLTSLEMMELYTQIEIPMMSILALMEHNGILIDVSYLTQLKNEFSAEMTSLKVEVNGLSDSDFNLNSPKQLGEILFEKLKIQDILKIKKVKKTKSGYSTSSDTLEQYKNLSVVQKILRYRQISKLYSTYIEALLNIRDKKTDRVHTCYNQTVTKTGRLSSTNPNLQNIPIRTNEGMKIRRSFIAAKDSLLISFDYSQIELRLLAHLSGDPEMIDAFEKNIDIHAVTASKIFNLPLQEVDDELRRKAKAVNFGVVYGMGAFKLSKDTNMSIKEAASFIKNYFSVYQGVKLYIDEQINSARKKEWVRNLFGRIRYLPDINSSRGDKRILAEHMAVNTPIQGTAADLIKKSMIEINKRVLQAKLSSLMVLQVHDELVFEVKNKEKEELIKLVKSSMEEVLLLRVPLCVNVNYGKNWLEAH